MSDPIYGLGMLGLIVVAIMLGFPTAFTLMGLGMIFGFLAFYTPGQPWYENHVFDLIVQRAYGVMNNDTLLSVPLFVFMGYIMERAALVDRMFHSVQLAFRRVPASLAVTTLLVCAFWGIASGIVGAVVVLMGVIAMRPMLRAGYDVRLAAGCITAGGTLGILIPPSVMLIVYAAVAGESIVKLYAAAMLPGFFLTGLYLAYILGWALLKPEIAPKLSPEQYRVTVPQWVSGLERGRARRVLPGLLTALLRPRRWAANESQAGRTSAYGLLLRSLVVVSLPLALTVVTFAGAWWYVLIHNAPTAEAAPAAPAPALAAAASAPEAAPEELGSPRELGATAASPTPGVPADDAPQELGDAPQELGDAPQELGDAPQELGDAPQELGATPAPSAATEAAPQELDAPEELGGALAPAVTGEPGAAPPAAPSAAAQSSGGVDNVGQAPPHFYAWFWGLAALSCLLLAAYYYRLDGEGLEIARELAISVVPLGVLTIVVLAVILFGITTATESAAIGALSALYLAVLSRHPRSVAWWSLGGGILGAALGLWRGGGTVLIVSTCLGAVFAGSTGPWMTNLRGSRELWENLKQATFLTAKTTAMVCWLFVGSALFSAVFALHGGQKIIETWVLGMNLSPVGFLVLSQLIIFLLGWPLEWTEIIVIFCPIFIPLLGHFKVNPILFGTMVAVNLQAAFLSPPVAMSAFYLKGVSPAHVTLNQIFAGMMPYMLIVILCLVIMYVWPGMTLWLPEFLYGN